MFKLDSCCRGIQLQCLVRVQTGSEVLQHVVAVRCGGPAAVGFERSVVMFPEFKCLNFVKEFMSR